MDSEQQVNRVFDEARAKIIWGDSVDEVRDWLDGQNISRVRIDEILARCIREQGVEFRKRGTVEVIIGGLVLVLSLLSVAAIHFIGILDARSAVLCYLAALYGLSRCGKGVWWLLRGAKSEGSLAEV